MEELAKKLTQWIEGQAEKEWQSLIGDDNEAIPDEDALLYRAFEEDLIEWLVERMANHPAVQEALEDARITIRETAAEVAAYSRAMGTVEGQLRWHGMSTKDFI